VGFTGYGLGKLHFGSACTSVGTPAWGPSDINVEFLVFQARLSDDLTYRENRQAQVLLGGVAFRASVPIELRQEEIH
jgi:hypothetical protein